MEGGVRGEKSSVYVRKGLRRQTRQKYCIAMKRKIKWSHVHVPCIHVDPIVQEDLGALVGALFTRYGESGDHDSFANWVVGFCRSLKCVRNQELLENLRVPLFCRLVYSHKQDLVAGRLCNRPLPRRLPREQDLCTLETIHFACQQKKGIAKTIVDA